MILFNFFSLLFYTEYYLDVIIISIPFSDSFNWFSRSIIRSNPFGLMLLFFINIIKYLLLASYASFNLNKSNLTHQ